jgi:hypothetical protein
MEGYRLFDLRRWDVDVDVLNTFLTVEKQSDQHCLLVQKQ